jgi:integrase
MAKTLTALSARNVRPDPTKRLEVSAGHGLYLVCQSSGVKSWAYRYAFAGKQSKLTLGGYLADGQHGADAEPKLGGPLSLAQARVLAAQAKLQVKGGTDPAAAKRKLHFIQGEAAANTLGAIAQEYLKREGPALRSLVQRQSDLELLCRGPLGKLPVGEIRRSHYRTVLDRIADENGPVRSDRCLSALTRLLNWHASRDDYFTSPIIRGMRRVKPKDLARSRVLNDDELQRLWMAAEKYSGPFGAYLRFVLLTATRRNEVAGLRRSELSDDGATWVIPGSRYKSGNDTLIPLSEAAQAIIARQPMIGDYVFSADGSRPLGGFDDRKKAFDKVAGVSGYRLHDLRRSARTLLSRAGIPADISEMCLGHTLSGVRGTYDRHAYQVEKAHAFEALARQIEHVVRPKAVADLAVERGKRGRRR